MKLPRRKNTVRFFRGFFTPVAALLIIVGLSAGVLYRAGEYMTMPAVADKVFRTGGVFGSALHAQAFWYKQEIYKRIRPQVATLGSSRTLLLRPAHFTLPFANLGLMSSIDEELEIAKSLFEDNPPKYLLLEAPWWWFHKAAATEPIKRSPAIAKPSLSELLKPLRWLFSGETSFGETAGMLLKPSPSVGVTGVLHDQGYEASGAFRYTATLNGVTENQDKGFKGTMAATKGGDKAFLGAQHVAPGEWKKFQALLDYLASKNIHVFFFVPPVAPTILTLMDKEGPKFAYMKELSAKLEAEMAKRGFGYADFHDARAKGFTDCEFIDGLHGGYIIYDKILLAMAANDKRLAPLVNTAFTVREIKANEGKASARADEIDFLGLGCSR